MKLEGEQEEREEAEGTKGIRGRSFYATEAETSIATTSSVAEKARNAVSVGNNRACSDRGS